MGTQYSHLSLFERQLMFKWYHYDKHSMREIARRLHRSHTTISREIKRNMCTHYVPTWYPHPAYLMYRIRIRDRAQRPYLKTNKTRNYVREKLRLGWSPEIISGRLKLEGNLKYACHESIYQFIYKEEPELIQYLPRKHKKRRVKKPYRIKPSRIKGRKSLVERPVEADDRTQIGHWESDTIVSVDRKCGLNVIVDRKSRLVHISFVKDKTAKLTHEAIVNRLKNHPNKLSKTITYDNGTENTQHLKTNEMLEITSYFCEPYSSWEKGSVEQVNGLIRRYFPKGTCLKSLTYVEINRVEKLLNNRPRKCLGYLTPYEVFREERGALSG